MAKFTGFRKDKSTISGFAGTVRPRDRGLRQIGTSGAFVKTMFQPKSQSTDPNEAKYKAARQAAIANGTAQGSALRGRQPARGDIPIPNLKAGGVTVGQNPELEVGKPLPTRIGVTGSEPVRQPPQPQGSFTPTPNRPAVGGVATPEGSGDTGIVQVPPSQPQQPGAATPYGDVGQIVQREAIRQRGYPAQQTNPADLYPRGANTQPYDPALLAEQVVATEQQGAKMDQLRQRVTAPRPDVQIPFPEGAYTGNPELPMRDTAPEVIAQYRELMAQRDKLRETPPQQRNYKQIAQINALNEQMEDIRPPGGAPRGWYNYRNVPSYSELGQKQNAIRDERNAFFAFEDNPTPAPAAQPAATPPPREFPQGPAQDITAGVPAPAEVVAEEEAAAAADAPVEEVPVALRNRYNPDNWVQNEDGTRTYTFDNGSYAIDQSIQGPEAEAQNAAAREAYYARAAQEQAQRMQGLRNANQRAAQVNRARQIREFGGSRQTGRGRGLADPTTRLDGSSKSVLRPSDIEKIRSRINRSIKGTNVALEGQRNQAFANVMNAYNQGQLSANEARRISVEEAQGLASEQRLRDRLGLDMRKEDREDRQQLIDQQNDALDRAVTLRGQDILSDYYGDSVSAQREGIAANERGNIRTNQTQREGNFLSFYDSLLGREAAGRTAAATARAERRDKLMTDMFSFDNGDGEFVYNPQRAVQALEIMSTAKDAEGNPIDFDQLSDQQFLQATIAAREFTTLADNYEKITGNRLNNINEIFPVDEMRDINWSDVWAPGNKISVLDKLAEIWDLGGYNPLYLFRNKKLARTKDGRLVDLQELLSRTRQTSEEFGERFLPRAKPNRRGLRREEYD